jgi:hypothetical protein
MKTYAQNATTANTAASQTTNMTNMTGLASGTGENDDTGEVEEGPGDVDINDQED